MVRNKYKIIIEKINLKYFFQEKNILKTIQILIIENTI